ncbi:ABC1 kinase family protein [Thermocatellispora tengchongensis]|uniref:ABC1 kinase family protein n=1 Tax=Thermocatellispora tengchongensis TaxID=1073253 RepID=UPI0036308043
MAPAPWPEVERTLAAELGAPVDEVFAAFDREPLAAASIAQVHAARLRSGEDVVVKVRRPGIEDVVARDLDIVDRLARTIATRTRWGHAIGVRELADGFAEALREELDFRVEADNMVAVAAASAAADGGDGGAPGVRVPAPHLELCSRRVLVMERLSGTSLAAAGDVIARLGLDPGELAGRLLRSLLRQIMVDGVFHADPHPGNVLLLDDGRLALLDFGSVGRLDVALREALRRLLLALDRGDPLAVTDVLLEIAARPEEIDQERLERALGQFLARHLGAGQTPGVRMFTDLFRIVAAYGLSVPAEVAAVFRALATVEGALASLSPGFDIVAEARAFGDAYLAERLGPEAAREMATRELLALLPMLRRLPRRVDRILSAAEHGRFAVNVRLLADERDRGHVAAMLHQVLITVLAATGGLMAVLLLGIDSGPRMTDAVGLYEFLGYNLLVISMILALRVLAGIFRRSGGA